MRALVLGSQGTVGDPLAHWLKDQGHQVLEYDIRPGWREGFRPGDIAHSADLMPCFDFQPDTVFLLAAQVGRMVCEQSPISTLSTNVIGVQNVIELTRRVNARLAFISTSEVYGRGKAVMREDDPDPHPENFYGMSKLIGEQLVRYAMDRGLDAIILRPFCIYSEHEPRGDHRSALIRFANRLAHGQGIDVHRGTARGWLHVSDAVRMIATAAMERSGETINIGHPDIIDTEALAEMIRVEVDASPDLIRLIDIPPGLTPRKYPDLGRMLSLSSKAPLVSLPEGIERVCANIVKRIAAVPAD